MFHDLSAELLIFFLSVGPYEKQLVSFRFGRRHSLSIRIKRSDVKFDRSVMLHANVSKER